MIIKRIISTFLVAFTLLGSMSLAISAQEQASPEAPVYEYNTSRNTPTMNYLTGEYKDPVTNKTTVISTKEQKLEVMDLRLEQNGFRMYVDEYSGEVAVENIATGDVLFSNPYDVGVNDELDEEEKKKFLSQIFIDYKGIKGDGSVYNSYENAVGGADGEGASQIVVKAIKNGMRIEYSIGRVDARYLVPERISKDNFEKKILNVAKEAGCSDFEEKQFKAFFLEMDLEKSLSTYKDEDKKAEAKRTFITKYGISENSAEKGPFYVCTCVTKKEYQYIENLIKKYCPDYTYEELDEEHRSFSYSPEDKNEALFKISLEYTIDEKGLSVRVPANGIRFDETLYYLEYIEILPFFGAGQYPNKGYTFFPDGAGTLFDFDGTETHFYGDCYGEDFAYYDLGTGSPHNQEVRYPVFGLTENITDDEGNERDRGFVAIVEEGDAMMTLYACHEKYNSVKMRVNPRPYDSYTLSGVIAGAENKPLPIVSPRNYTGNFKIRYIMLTDEDVATGKGYYEPTYVGMAKVYRDYLVENNVLTRLTKSDVKENIPLYIETFGAIETTQKFLSIPYKTTMPLTSFEDITKMYDELSESGIDNINFILTGYNKGGLSVDQVPYSLNWENAVEKEMKFDELIEYARTNGFGVYPDFDFVFATDNKLFDGLTLSSHAVKKVDGRYTSKREYSATRQSYVSYFELAMSPAYFSHFYEKLTKNYVKYNPLGISVSSLGMYLNSDFDEDDPYNREDAKEFTAEALKYFDDNYNKVLVSGGNAYTWKYVDYITEIATDSSRHATSLATVPFLGIVLHGYVQTAGEAINMEGNMDYAMLRAIENGASLKFILSYQNTAMLKGYPNTSKYYSVRYDIWASELVEAYNKVNAALKDVQLSTIEHHEFLDGARIPNEDEIDKDSYAALLDAINKEIVDAADAKESLRVLFQSIRQDLYDCRDNLAAIIDTNDETNTKSIKAIYDKASPLLDAVKSAAEDVEAQKTIVDNAYAKYLADPSEKNDTKYREALDSYGVVVSSFKDAYDAYIKETGVAINLGNEYVEKFEQANDNFGMLEDSNVYNDEIITELDDIRKSLIPTYNSLKNMVNKMTNEVKNNVRSIEEKYATELGLVGEKEEESVEKFDQYAAAPNSIVYEVFENGKSFVLNFNNYAVKVKVGNVYYTIDAYSYIIMR